MKKVVARLLVLDLLGRGTGVVLATPGEVPDTGDEASGDEDGRGVVDGGRSDGDEGGHAEQRHGEERPG